MSNPPQGLPELVRILSLSPLEKGLLRERLALAGCASQNRWYDFGYFLRAFRASYSGDDENNGFMKLI